MLFDTAVEIVFGGKGARGRSYAWVRRVIMLNTATVSLGANCTGVVSEGDDGGAVGAS
jgi:hypothetical protein